MHHFWCIRQVIVCREPVVLCCQPPVIVKERVQAVIVDAALLILDAVRGILDAFDSVLHSRTDLSFAGIDKIDLVIDQRRGPDRLTDRCAYRFFVCVMEIPVSIPVPYGRFKNSLLIIEMIFSSSSVDSIMVSI